tara:strand:+ start:6289 stop:7329 length:1041 start_codon:yes stop_codon:yes gene_type:complete
MPRSYGSYYTERKKDKPYRAAEIALGFLGNIMESKNVQALQYDKLLAEKEKAEALKTYRTESLGVQKQALGAKTIQHDPRKGATYQFDPESGTYNILAGTGVGAGAGGTYGTNWGKFYADVHLDTYLDGHIEYGEDANKDGVPDRTFVGPDAQLFRDYKTAKANKTEGWEALHPDKVVEGYRGMKNPSDEQKQQILDYFNGIQKYKDLYEDNQLLARIAQDPYVEEDDARLAYQNIEKKYKPKPLAYSDKVTIQENLNTRERMIGWLSGATSATTYKKIEEDFWTDPDIEKGGVERSSERITTKVFKAGEREAMQAQVEAIEKLLSGYGVKFTPYKEYDPLGILGK